ncbi:LysR family transcriptional regulator [Aurantiacibacter suaedae]|uniref:LysR family transcriptional regulator n=1 Tax=Aurantiacibacter suaedae TaxID=2545755 RepID=UPI0010F510CC|nr:LysR family transcriptional regulator [Aurantiacibacter suaedae]
MPALPFTLRQLEVFAHLAASGSFRATADELGISQASVSNQIKTLEEQLGRRLLNRKPGQRPILTAVGQAFYDDMGDFERAAHKLAGYRRVASLEAGPVRYRLLVGQGNFDNYVRPQLDRFLAEHPMLDLSFNTQPPSHELMGTISTGQYDFALINRPVDLPPEPQHEKLARVQGGIYAHRRLVEGEVLPLDPAQVSAMPFVLPPAGSKQEREKLITLANHDVRPVKVVCHTQYYDVMAAMLERGVAVASLTDAIFPPSMRENVILILPMVDWDLEFYRKPGLTHPSADMIDDFLKSCMLDNPDYPALRIY